MAGNGRKAYSPEYRRRVVELARSGRSPGALAKEFEPTAQTIRNWVRRADADEGLGGEGSAKALRRELAAYKRRVKRVEMERDILKKAAAWFAMESGSIPGRGTRS